MQNLKFKLNLKQTLKLLVYNFLFIGVLYFAYKNIDWGNLRLSEINLNVIYLVISAFCFFLFYISFAFGWQKIVRLYVLDNPSPVFMTYLSAQMFKYLPSSIFLFSSQAMFTKNLGFSYKKITLAILMQYLFVFYSAFVVFFAFSGQTRLACLMLFVLCLGFFLVSSGKLNLNKLFFIGHIFNFERKNLSEFLHITLLHLCAWIFNGLALYFFSLGLGYTAEINNVISSQTLSSTASILAVFAPGGLGVREYFLSLAYLNLNLIVVWRIFTTIFDIALSLISIAILKRFKTNSS